MLKDLIKLANALDGKGLRKEADYLDEVIQKLAYTASPGSAFDSAIREGNAAQIRAEEISEQKKYTGPAQKTLDWFNNYVFPQIKSGSKNISIEVSEPLFVTSKIMQNLKQFDVYIPKQTITEQNLDKVKMDDTDGYGQRQRYASLKDIYEILEQFVIDNKLPVTMESYI